MTFAVAAATVVAAVVTVGAVAGGSAGSPAIAGTAVMGDVASFDPAIGPRLLGDAGSRQAARGPAQLTAATPSHANGGARHDHNDHTRHPAAGSGSRRAGASGADGRSSHRNNTARPNHTASAGSAHSGRRAPSGRAQSKLRKGRSQAAHARPKPALRTTPYTIYDSVNPSAIPPRQATAAYATGSFAAQPSQLRGLGHVIWIDTTGRDYAASALDVEPGDATPSQAASWVWRRLRAYPQAVVRVYTMQSEWPAVRTAFAGLPGWMRARVRWWIADPTGFPHIVPGADATQWYWGSGFDKTLARPGF